MAVQTLEHELGTGVAAPAHAVVQNLAPDASQAQQSEVQILRQRVAMLENRLAAAEAKRADAATAAVPLTSIDFAPRSHAPQGPASEFAEPVVPAVVVISPAPSAVSTPSTDTDDADITSQPTDQEQFASAWSDDDVSFEERVAAKAFFQDDTVDSQSRDWLLKG